MVGKEKITALKDKKKTKQKEEEKRRGKARRSSFGPQCGKDWIWSCCCMW
jgi:hypothetical protein